MRLSSSILFLFILTSLRLNANENVFNQANQFFNEGEYQSAANIYQSLVDSNWQSNHLLYNLGTSYYFLNQAGKSILYLEKAKKINPSSSKIQHNLSLAYSLTSDNYEPVPDLKIVKWFRQIMLFFKPQHLFFFVILFALLHLFIGIAIHYKQKESWKPFQKSSFILAIIALFLFFGQKIYLNQQKWAILQKDTSVLTKPEENSTKEIQLFEGRKIEIVDELQEWYKIEIPEEDKSGWILKEYVERI